MASAAQIQVIGMKETRKGLRDASTDNAWRVGLRGVFGPVATLVQGAAQSKASGTRMGSAAVSSIRGKASTTGAQIQAFKGETGDYGPGFEYGSNGTYPQFGPRTPGGKSLYPAITDTRPQIEELVMGGIDTMLESTFPE